MERTTKEGFNVTQYLADLARRLDTERHGRRRALIEEAAGMLGWSYARVYRQLRRRLAWSSGRRTRADKGTTSQPADALATVASMQRQSIRKNGKQVLHLPTALSIAATNGAKVAVSRPQFGRLLRDRKLDARAQQLDRPAQSMRSLHPNHVHQVDPSLCLLYFLNGEQRIMRDDQELYKNKLDKYIKIQAKIWRYVLYDHASSYIDTWYVEARGESSGNLFDALMHFWGRQDGRPFHGAPKILIWDKGSANTSHPVKNFLRAIDVRDIAHAAGNPRAKGGVEGANNIVECKFESRLRFEPVQSVAELNRAAAAWANAFNANLIPHEDTRLNRPGLPEPVARYDLWFTIRTDELRVLPDAEKCKLFLEGKSAERKVSRGLSITYKHPLQARDEPPKSYELAGFDGICAGDKVEVSPLVFGDCEVYVRAKRYDGADLEYRVKPLNFDPQYGFRADAPVFGEEYRAKPDTEIERQGKRLDRLAYPGRTLAEIQKSKDKNEAPFSGRVQAHSHLLNVAVPQALATRRGSEIAMPDRARPEPLRLTRTAALILLHRSGEALNDAERAAFDAMMTARADGITEEELKAWLAQTRARPDTDTELRLIK